MKLNIEDRNVTLLCPNCKEVEFITSDDSDIVTCNGCKLSLEKNELIEQNQGQIEDQVEEIKKDLQKQFKDIFKKWN